MVTETQRKNRLIFLERWKTIPPKNVYPNLEFWNTEPGDTPTCNTIACAGEWCALMPDFQALGVQQDSMGAPWMKDAEWAHEVSKQLFGDKELFAMRLSSETGTDHEVVTKRFMKGM